MLICGWWRSHADLRVVAAAPLAVLAMTIACAAAQGTIGIGDAGGAVPSCASKLVPCGGYLNSTATPPASCCGPLKAAANETACMCSILMNKAALQAFGVAPEQGLLLAKRCGVTTDTSVCSKPTATGAPTAASSASTGTATSTVAKPTASGGVTHCLSLIVTSSLLGFSFIWGMMMIMAW